MTWNDQSKNLSSFANGVKQFLISYLLWTDGGYLMYTDENGDEGRIILEDHSFANLPQHPSLFGDGSKHSSNFNNQNKHSSVYQDQVKH